MMYYYTGVGSRQTPPNILELMTEIAKVLAKEGYILRSGGAQGADLAFEAGAGEFKEIFYAKDSTPEAEAISAKYHPAWNRCSDYARKLHGRNAFQVLGKDLKTPSKFLICWTPDGCSSHYSRVFSTGGTGTAISIATFNNIDIHNLFNEAIANRWFHWLASKKIRR